MLFCSAKSNGSFDDGRYEDTCFQIQKSFVSPRVKKYLGSMKWKKVAFWDKVLHQAANKSLDMTIEKLGRSTFQSNLDKFRRAKQAVAEMCTSKVILPCNTTGTPTPIEETNCIHGDLGCGFECMDEYFQHSNESFAVRVS